MQQRPRTLGVSIDGYAVEGGYDTAEGPPTAFGAAQAFGMVRRSLGSQRTFEHLPELVDQIADLGANEVRLTMEWARLEPRPNDLDLDAFGVYDRALRAAEHRGLSAVVVLCDAAWPSWLGQEPWLSTWAPDRFASHAQWVATRLEGRLRALVTFRAPNATARRGWIDGVAPPFRGRATADGASALDGMLLAHQLAVEALAARAPTTVCGLLFEASWSYEDEPILRDLAIGLDAAARRDSEEVWQSLVARSIATPNPRRNGWGRAEVLAMRSTQRWASTPSSEWWLASHEPALLGAALEHAKGRVATVELGVDGRACDEQLLTASGALERARCVHLYGALASSGPLSTPHGLFDLELHDGAWTLTAPDQRVLDAVARLVP